MSPRAAALAVFAVTVLSGCAQTETPPPEAALYIQYCAVCHGEDGRTMPDLPSTPNLNSQGLLTVVDDAFLFESIARGRPGENGRGKPGTKMSAYGEEHRGPLTTAEIDQIVTHIRSWQTAPGIDLEPYAAEGDAASGQEVYTVCVPCHGPEGWSAAAPSLAGATFQDIASDAFIRHTVLYGRPGTTMPGFNLDEREVADLIVFIRSLYEPEGGP